MLIGGLRSCFATYKIYLLTFALSRLAIGLLCLRSTLEKPSLSLVFCFLSSYSIACVVTNGSAQHVGQTGTEDIHSHSILNRV